MSFDCIKQVAQSYELHNRKYLIRQVFILNSID